MKWLKMILLLGLFTGIIRAQECDHQHIVQSPDTCQFVKDNCDPSSIINFNEFYYCTLNQNLAAVLPICIVVIVLSFYILGSTADVYLSPALARISKMCNMSENLAGVTLLALGNGAPDVFSSIAASGDQDSGVSVAIGALTGSGFFVGNLVFAMVIICSKKEIKVNPSSFLRDIIFYLIGLLLIACFALIGYINIFMAVSVLLLYVIYVAFIAINQVRQNKKKKKDRQRQRLLPKDARKSDGYPNLFDSQIKPKSAYSLHTIRGGGDTVISQGQFSPSSPGNSSSQNMLEEEGPFGETALSPKTNELEIVEEVQEGKGSEIFEQSIVYLPKGTRYQTITNSLETSLVANHYQGHESGSITRPKLVKRKSTLAKSAAKIKSKAAWSLVKAQYWVKNIANSEQPWEKKNCCSRTTFILLDTPLDFIRRLTILPFEDALWSRLFATLVPPCATIFFFFCTQLNILQVGPVHIWWPIAILMLIPSAIIYCTSHAKKAPSYAKYFAYEAFIMSIVWIWFIANILVDVLQLIGYISGIAPAYLGLTLLALGNSIGDLVADLAISKMGFGELAVTGCVAGPLFNLLLGMGISLTKTIASNGTETFTIRDPQNRLPLGCLAFLVLAYIILIIIISARKFTIPRAAGWFLLCTFIIYLIWASILAFVL